MPTQDAQVSGTDVQCWSCRRSLPSTDGVSIHPSDAWMYDARERVWRVTTKVRRKIDYAKSASNSSRVTPDQRRRFIERVNEGPDAFIQLDLDPSSEYREYSADQIERSEAEVLPVAVECWFCSRTNRVAGVE